MRNLNQILNYLIGLSLAIIVGGYFYFNQPTSVVPENLKTQKLTAEQQRKADESVNRYMQRAHHEAKFSQFKVERELEEARKKVEEDKKAQIILEEQRQQEMATQDQIYRAPKQADATSNKSESAFGTPDVNSGQINSASESFPSDVKSMTPEQKREYARQYIENARKGGYSIELSDDLEVIRATPIRKPSQQRPPPDSIESYPTD